MIAESPAMQPDLQVIARVGPSDANVLITGENGTGKGVVAQALHAVSARAGKPMLTVNTGGLSEGVFESELFGHVKGAFTDARSDRVGRFRTGRRRDAVSRRNRQRAAGTAGEAPSGVGDRAV
jgi:transcriptional regulator with GAF, ATPase, and Fis domain